jgi:hypothetical protein
METHFNIQRRLYDYQFSLAKTPMEFEQRHHAFIQLYHTTAHQGLLREGFHPPIPSHVLGEAKGRLYSAEDLHRPAWLRGAAPLPLPCRRGAAPTARASMALGRQAAGGL